jgi:phenylacetic acid degradation operon negative regulatory protein
MPRASRPVVDASITRRSRSLILDIYGAYIRPLGNWLAVADLVTLMGVLGVEQPAVRSAVSRMSRTGLLTRVPRGGVAGYSLSDEALPMMERGDRRIFATREPARLEDGWALVVVSVPEAERDRRYQLRKRLTWLGFGNLAGGVWIAPRRVLPELSPVLEQFALSDYVQVFVGDFDGIGDPHALASAWDIEWLRSLYTKFLRAAAPVARRWSSAGHDDETAFVDYTVLLHAWRRLPYLDPGLPPELVSDDWEGRVAANTFFDIRARLEPRAAAYVSSVVTH